MPKLLIIEDDAVLRQALSEYLKTEGFEVVCGEDGEIGQQMVKTEKPNLILLDIVLPKKDGYEVLKEVKADPETKNIPIVLLTNLGSIDDVQKALELGATTYLVKSDYRLEEITAKIKQILHLN